MKYFILLLALCLLVVPVLATGNTISNGNFETGVLSPWYTGGDYAATIGSGEGRSSGDAAKFVVWPAPASMKDGYIYQTPSYTTGAGTLTYYFLVGTLTGSGSLYIDVYEDGNLKSSHSVAGYTGGGWYQRSVSGFSTSGSHVITIHVAFLSGRGGSVWIDDIVMTSAVPTASYSASPTSGEAGVTEISFTGTATGAQSIGAVNAYSWTFGDGYTSTQLSPSHTFNTAGTYYPDFIAANYWDHTHASTTAITIVSVISPSFTHTSAATGVSMSFTDTSTNSPTSWDWDWGDGTTHGNTQNPTHTYTTAGTRTVRLTASKSGSSHYVDHSITVSDDLTAAFTCTPLVLVPSQSMTCTDTSSVGPTGWAWTFGDTTTSSSQNPTKSYAAAGTYTVALTATKPYQTNTLTRTGYVTVGNAPSVTFTGTPLSGTIPLTVVFTATNTGGYADSWLWTFGDGVTTNNSVQNPVHTYTTGGTFNVVATATNNTYGSGSQTRNGYVTTGSIPIVSFTANRSLVTIPRGAVQFTDASTNTPTSWDWGWGDGTANGTTQNPVHNFTVAGTYSIGLRATNSFGTGWFSNTSMITVLAASAPGSAGYTIPGLVTSSDTGLAIPSAEITLSNITNGSTWSFTTYSSNTGTFYFVGLLNGTYILSSSQSGYNSYSSTGIVISGSDSLPIPVVLTPSTTVPSSMRYYPHLTRFVLKDIYGNPIPGVLVTAQGYEVTASHNWVLEMIGLDLSRTRLDTQAMSGTTGSDGSVVFLMLEIVSYDITFTGGPIAGSPTQTIFPKEDSYLFQLAVTGAGELFSEGSSAFGYNLTATGLNYTALNLHGDFTDSTGGTTSVFFWVTNATGYPVYNQTIAGNNISTDHVVMPFIPGALYYFGMNVTNPTYGYINYRELITAPNGRLLHPLEDLGIDVVWYKWITIIALIVFVAMFSGITNVYGSLLFPIWALFFTFIGWLDWCPWPFTVGVAALGGMIFISKRNSQVGEG